jgi:xylulose-5-phosphate/fructose-6-phosphate phosphoketolase
MATAVTVEKATEELSAYGSARSTVEGKPFSTDELRNIHAYWRACNYLTLSMKMWLLV